MRYWIFTHAYEVDARHLAAYRRMPLEDFIIEEGIDRLLGDPDAMLRDNIELLLDRVKGAISQRPFDYNLSGMVSIVKLPDDNCNHFAFCIQNAQRGSVTVLSPKRIPHLEGVDKARERYRNPTNSLFTD
ncbi:MAG TPA: hypothetical protein PLI43_13295 [Albidovulum sp.]|uniref:hypothetical protein n=1 Tax=Albidovulum sp. TaxID=1872424 RepID=UPI002C7BFD88|nr:hypothetical protein [Albidovulum sp.]